MKSGFRRTKRVTDPFDAEAKARIVGRVRRGPDYVSSGSEHCADDVDSPSLSEIFFGFNADVNDAGESSSPESGDSDCELDRSKCEPSCASADLIRPILQDRNDAFRSVLRAHVLSAVQIFSCVRSSKEVVRRNVMAYLRNCGYNAAVCKTKWESCGGLAAGSYEFIDVVRQECSSARYFIDLDFVAEFEIARPTESYERLLQQLPKVFVGACEDLKQILRAASDGARRSLKSGGLHLPPWRKHRFMQNKWLGPHRRTTNIFPASFSSPSTAQRGHSIKCRAVGFNADGHLLFPATARTR